MNRAFKGIWIPREIWLSTELTMIEKVILVEIDSLDNEEHCTAGNDYFAEFCNCSKSAVTKAIAHLKELGYIEVLEFDGRHRKLRVVNFTKQSSKIYDADSENLLSNNTINNITNNKNNNSKELLLTKNSKSNSSFLGSVSQKKEEKPKKKNLYEKCIDIIDDYTDNKELRDALRLYLEYRLGIKDKPLYAGIWKGLITKLTSIDQNNVDTALAIVNQSIERGYLSFYPVNTYTNYKSTNCTLHDKINESGAVNVPHITEEEERELERLVESGELREY